MKYTAIHGILRGIIEKKDITAYCRIDGEHNVNDSIENQLQIADSVKSCVDNEYIVKVMALGRTTSTFIPTQKGFELYRNEIEYRDLPEKNWKDWNEEETDRKTILPPFHHAIEKLKINEDKYFSKRIRSVKELKELINKLPDDLQISTINEYHRGILKDNIVVSLIKSVSLENSRNEIYRVRQNNDSDKSTEKDFLLIE